jgi:VWFA-related protein
LQRNLSSAAVVLVALFLNTTETMGAAAARRARDAGTAEPRFEAQAQVLAVEVPVTVIGRDGEPVRGLTAENFDIFDNGSKQVVSGFQVVDLATRSATPRGVGPTAQRLRASGRRHFLLLFDLSFAQPAAIFKARVAAREFAEHSLHPDDLAAVATVSLEEGVRLVVTFTPDRAQLARGIDTLGTRSAAEAALVGDPLRFVIAPPGTTTALVRTGDGASSREAAGQEFLQVIEREIDRTQKTFDRSRITAMTRTLADLARTLNSVQGRKHVVLFSEGFDARLLLGREVEAIPEQETEALDAAFGRLWQVDSDNRYGNTVLQNRLFQMLEEFRRADCVIQAVDIGGLRTSGDATGSLRRTGTEALFVMANETGGELFEDANDLKAQLDKLLARNSVTYILTFERSDLVANGAYHRLEVKGRVPAGARLRHRSGYYAPRPFQDLDPLEKDLLAAGGIASGMPREDLDLAVLAAPFRAGGGEAYVPVIIEIGGAGLLEGQSQQQLALEIYAYASDNEGRMRDFFTQSLQVDLSTGRETLRRAGLKYYGHLELQAGEHLLRVLVRNAETGRTGIASLEIRVPAALDAPVLLPPFFLEGPGRWLLVRERAAMGQSDVVYPFTVNGEPYVPAARPVLSGASSAKLCLVAYNLGPGEAALTASVHLPSGERVEGGKLALVERTATGIEGLDKYLAEFGPVGLKPGRYTLQISARGGEAGGRFMSSIPFDVI